MAGYDYLVVGAGLYGSVFASRMKEAGKKVKVIDRRHHIGGNVYTEKRDGIHVHTYGAHIFHTNDERVWEYVNRFTRFNNFVNSPIANYRGEIYSLPFNMYTFNRIWGVVTPEEARERIELSKKESGITDPSNLEEQAISLVGREIYEKLIKGYTQKQWGRDCKELPAFIIKRLPVRYTYNNNYFNAAYQGIPVGGYTAMIEKMLEGIEVETGVDFLRNRAELEKEAVTVLFTGAIDEYFDHVFGRLEYRTLDFRDEELDIPNFQGNAAVNYTDSDTGFTRIIEHKWITFGLDDDGVEIEKTIITREYPKSYEPGDEPYYPVNDAKNTELFKKYRALASEKENVVFGGRLGDYSYYDMDVVIRKALEEADCRS